MSTEKESSLHPVSLLLWRVLDALGQAGHSCLNLEGVEVIKAGELTVAPCELTKNHGRVVELIA